MTDASQCLCLVLSVMPCVSANVGCMCRR